jgi:hypothetical protein
MNSSRKIRDLAVRMTICAKRKPKLRRAGRTSDKAKPG